MQCLKPDRIYPGKNAPWFIVLMLAVAAVAIWLSLAMLEQFWNYQPWCWLWLLLIPTALVICILPLASNRVELYSDHLEIVYALTRTKLPYSAVRSVHPTHTLLAGTANSLNRVLISDTYGTNYIVATKNKHSFITELTQCCPNLISPQTTDAKRTKS